GLYSRAHHFSDEGRGVDHQAQQQSREFWRQRDAPYEVEAFQLGCFNRELGTPSDPTSKWEGKQEGNGHTAQGENLPGRGLSLTGPMTNQNYQHDGQSQTAQYPVQGVSVQRRHFQAAVGQEHTRQGVQRLARARHVFGDDGIPEEQLQQQGNVAHDFHIDARHARN